MFDAIAPKLFIRFINPLLHIHDVKAQFIFSFFANPPKRGFLKRDD